MESTSDKTIEDGWTVCLWASHPDDGNDDCVIGTDPLSQEAAEACFAALAIGRPVGTLAVQLDRNAGRWLIAVLEGPGVWRDAANPSPRSARREEDDAEWRRERAMQAGMAFGCDGYNDEMGY